MSLLSPLVVAQITDTHLFADEFESLRGCQTAQTLQAVLVQLHQVQPKPDLLLMTGDLSQDETPESYVYLRDRITPLDIPTYWIPGNHDVPAMMEQVLVSDLISPAKCFHRGGWNFILLCSAQPQRVEGELSPQTLDWLEAQLQQHAQPTLIALHHPPLPIGTTWMDRIGLHQPERFLAVVDRYPQVKLIMFGHIHQEVALKRNGVSYLGTPSTGVQFAPQDDFAIDDREPGFRLLYLQPDGKFTTQVVRVALP
jgi:Icc protein